MEATASKIDFSNKQIMKLLWPLILEQLLTMAVGLADSMMVAQVGDAAVSGVSLVDSISVLMNYVFSAMAAGGVAVCGQFLGHYNEDKAKKSGHHLIMTVLVLSFGISILLYIFNAPILNNLFGKIDADVMDATTKYYLIVMASVPGIALYNGGAALFRAMERTDITLKVSILMNVINVGGNALMIFGMGCGVEGVAVPTLISRWIAAIVILALLFNKKYPLNLLGIGHFRFEKQILKNIITFGVPSGVENGMFQLGKIILYSYISTLGTASITANAIGGVMAGFHVTVGNAINLTMTTIVSQCCGAGAFDKARYYFKKLLKWAYVMGAVWIGILIALTPTILKIYDVSPEATHMAFIVCMMHAISGIILWNISFVTPTFLRATGDATFTMIVSASSMWIGRVLMGVILGKYFGLGIYGVFIAHTIIDWIIRSIIFVIRYRSNKWESKAIKQ